MSFRPSAKQQREFEALIKGLEPVVRDAFLEVSRQIVSNTDFNRLVKAIEDGRVKDALRAIGIREGSFNALSEALAVAYTQAGVSVMASMPLIRDANGFKLNFQFNARNLRAERRLSAYTKGLIQDFTKEAEAVVRLTLTQGLAQGRNPRQVAQTLIGVMNPTTRRREGGLLSLNRSQSQYVMHSRADLEQKTIRYMKDGKEVAYKGSLSNYLARARRDARFDGTVKKAMLSGEALADDVINKLAGRYSDRLLITRANTIGQTEVMEALNAGRYESNMQIIDETGTDPDKAVKVWKATRDSRTREQHAGMDNAEAVGMDTPFTMPDGSQMLYPCDTSLGAGAGQTINCRCSYFVRINYFSKAA